MPSSFMPSIITEPLLRLRWRGMAGRILAEANRLAKVSHAERRERLAAIRDRIQRGALPDRELICVYALTAVAIEDAFGFRPHPEQLMGAIGLFRGQVVEMQTGEGKTITATFPAVLRALAGRGVHVVTANDYLAQRDAESMAAIYSRLGLTVAAVFDGMEDDDRASAYQADITYGTASQFGFDYLRDRMKLGVERRPDSSALPYEQQGVEGVVQRGHEAAVIDEVDSVLIDDAITPLLIGLPCENAPHEMATRAWARKICRDLSSDDIVHDPVKRSTTLTDHGCRQVLLTAKPKLLDGLHVETLYEAVETAYTAEHSYHAEQDYVVDAGEVVIIDESTGRKMEGRKWQRGLHQAVEFKEGLLMSESTYSAAQITVQSYFRMYRFLGGMTGTAMSERKEFRKVYRLGVTRIPPHRRVLRNNLPTQILTANDAKWTTVSTITKSSVEAGRAVLIGTVSVRASQELSETLTAAGIGHRVLNARQDAEEADIVGEAGQPGRVTIATNMAGRGTDIIVDREVLKAGGLHVIATARHSSTRIDRQLIGRTGRQGQPGSAQFVLAMTDELLSALPKRKQQQIQKLFGDSKSVPRKQERLFLQAQRRLERHGRKQRKRMLDAERKRLETFGSIGLDPQLELESDD